MSNTFTCEMCRETFEKGRSDEEALAEAKANLAKDGLPLDSPLGCVCSFCNKKLKVPFPKAHLCQCTDAIAFACSTYVSFGNPACVCECPCHRK